MTFINTLFLAALPLVAVPLIIHLYRGRQRDVIPWAAMDFLAQAATKGRSMQWLENLLLMVLRMGAVLALVLALAQPMVRSSWWRSEGDQEVLLVLDNSLSMSREIDGVSTWDLLVDRAMAIIGDLSGSDEVHLLATAGKRNWLTPEGVLADSTGQGRLRSVLESIEPNGGSADLLDSLQLAVHWDATRQASSRRIVVLSDNQQNSWQLESESAWQQLGAARAKAEVPTTIEVIDCAHQVADVLNLAATELSASRLRARPGKNIDFSATIVNLGSHESEESIVQWLLDGESFATSELGALGPQQSAQVTAKLTQDATGIYVVTCRIEADDEILLDQEESAVVEISDSVPILLVSDSDDAARNHGAPPASTKTVTALFTAALGYDGEQAQEWHSAYRPEITTYDALPDATLSRYHAIVLDGVPDLEAEVIDGLSAFVRSGGGLWITVGYGLNRATFNRQWFDDGDGLSPLKLDVLTRLDDPQAPASMIHPPSLEHPATAQLANTTQLDIDQGRLRQVWRLARSASGGEVSILLESGDGSPLVAEKYVGRGRVLVQAYSLGLDWSNLPRLKAYVVMIHDWLDYLTAPSNTRYNLAPGSAILASVPRSEDVERATLQTPTGELKSLTLRTREKDSTLRFAQTQLPGLYRLDLHGSQSTTLPFYVARNASESNLTVLDVAERAKLKQWAGIHLDGEEVAQPLAAEAAPRREPVWGGLLMLLLALLAGELLLSNWLGRRRHGVAVSSGAAVPTT